MCLAALNVRCGPAHETLGIFARSGARPAPPEAFPARDDSTGAPADTSMGPAALEPEADDDLLEATSSLPDPPADLDPSAIDDLSGRHQIPRGEKRPGNPVFRARIRGVMSETSLPNGESAAGSRHRWFGRLWFSPARWIQLGVVGEKDPYESPRHAFASAFIHAVPEAGGMEFIAGDYRVRAGSGILFAPASFSAIGSRLFAGGASGTSPWKPHASADENRFFRGVAGRVPLRFGSWSMQATLFASCVKRSGRVDASGAFTPYTYGLFRTPSEIRLLNSNRERSAGAVLSAREGSFGLEATGFWIRLDHPVRVGPPTAASCASWASGSIHARIGGSEFELSGEAAYSRALALTFEGRAAQLRDLTAIVQVQSIRPGFLSPFGMEGSGRPAAGNLTSGVLQCLVRPTRWVRGALSARLSFTSLPQTSDPLAATRIRLSGEAELLLTPGWSILASAGEARSEDGVTVADVDGRELRAMREDDRSTFRVQSVVSGGERWSMRNRFEFVTARRAPQGGRERGVLLQTDVKLRVAAGVRVAGRASVFDIGGWGARIYSPEEDVEGAMRIPVFTGRGARVYALFRWEFSPMAAFSCRYGATMQETAASGAFRERDVRDHERDVSIQLDIGF